MKKENKNYMKLDKKYLLLLKGGKQVMKYKIMAVLLGIVMLSIGGVLAGVFPNPFIINGNEDVTIIYGVNAASSDATGANSIGSNIIATWDAQQPEVIEEDISSSTTIVLGDENYLIASHGNDLNFLESLNSVEAKLTDKDLPGLLADGEIEEYDGEEIEYTQELILGTNRVRFGSLDEEDYMVNEDLTSNELPLLYLDSSNPVWELLIDFEKSVDARENELDDNAKIIIAGRVFTINPKAELNDDLILYGSTQEISINLGETKIVTIEGEEISISIQGANPETKEVNLIINGDYVTREEGDSINVNGKKLYVNNVHITTIPTDSVNVELFIGADEIEIAADITYNDVKVNGKTLDGVQAKLDSNTISSFKEISFRFIPSEMDEDDYEEGLEFLEIGETIVDPLFGTIALTFDEVDSALDSEDRDFIQLKSRNDLLEVTFTNIDGNEIIFKPYQESNGVLSYSEDLIIGSLTDLAEDNEFILQISGDITDVFLIEDIDDSDGEVEIYSYAEDESEIYEVGDTIDGTGVTINSIGSHIVTLNGDGVNVLNTENKMQIILGEVIVINGTITNKAIITFNENNMNDDESPVFAEVEITIELDSSDEIEITKLSSSDVTQANDNDNDNEYSVTQGFATLFVRDDDTDRLLKVYVPETEADMKIYVSAGAKEVIVEDSDDDVEGNETVIDDTPVIPTLGLGDLVFTDSSADLSEHNLVVVGGSCINQVAAELLGSSSPVCGEDFTTLTGVSENQYMIKTFVSPYNSEKIAILVAGYSAADTQSGVNALLGDNFEIPAVGSHYIV